MTPAWSFSCRRRQSILCFMRDRTHKLNEYRIQGDISTKTGAKAIADQLAEREERVRQIASSHSAIGNALITLKVDVLVNNAATQRPWKTPITEVVKHRDRECPSLVHW